MFLVAIIIFTFSYCHFFHNKWWSCYFAHFRQNIFSQKLENISITSWKTIFRELCCIYLLLKMHLSFGFNVFFSFSLLKFKQLNSLTPSDHYLFKFASNGSIRSHRCYNKKIKLCFLTRMITFSCHKFHNIWFETCTR